MNLPQTLAKNTSNTDKASIIKNMLHDPVFGSLELDLDKQRYNQTQTSDNNKDSKQVFQDPASSKEEGSGLSRNFPVHGELFFSENKSENANPPKSENELDFAKFFNKDINYSAEPETKNKEEFVADFSVFGKAAGEKIGKGVDAAKETTKKVATESLKVVGDITTESSVALKELLLKDILGMGGEKPKTEKEKAKAAEKKAEAIFVRQASQQLSAEQQQVRRENATKDEARIMGGITHETTIAQQAGIKNVLYKGARSIANFFAAVGNATEQALKQKKAASAYSLASSKGKGGNHWDQNKMGEQSVQHVLNAAG